MLQHPIAPVFDAKSRLLILGTFPSVKSRETMFYYGHPQNRFWRVLASVYQEPEPKTVEEKRALLLRRHVALWDVIACCDVSGSADSSIKNVVPNDMRIVLNGSSVQRVFTNGKKAKALYDRYIRPQTGLEALCLPSTSPANASWSLQRLCEAWRQLLDDGE